TFADIDTVNVLNASSLNLVAFLNVGGGGTEASLFDRDLGPSSPWPSPPGEGTTLFRSAKRHELVSIHGWSERFSLSLGERAGVRAILYSNWIIAGESVTEMLDPAPERSLPGRSVLHPQSGHGTSETSAPVRAAAGRMPALRFDGAFTV
ncbi:MAG: hypothetical protein L0Z50_07975, partial [Verrucomicrobiales bacterium]|nr:hypothetical protein [Verrucomicrobiales bacterium]